jgi:hypothetical protein
MALLGAKPHGFGWEIWEFGNLLFGVKKKIT